MLLFFRKPAFLFFDSLQSTEKKFGKYVGIVRALLQRYYAEIGLKVTTSSFSHTNLPQYYMALKKQPNKIDCGLYILEYVEKFMEVNML